MTRAKNAVTVSVQVPDLIRQILKRRPAVKSSFAQDVQSLYAQLCEEWRPNGLYAHSIVLSCAGLLYDIEEYKVIRSATFNAALVRVVEQCLKDMPATDRQEHAKYCLTGAKQDAIKWEKNGVFRKKINARLHRAGHSAALIHATAFAETREALDQIDRAIAFVEQRLQRLMRQIPVGYDTSHPDTPQ